MKERHVYIAVHPDFRKKLKVESSLSDMSIMDYTRELAKMPSIADVKSPKLEENEKKRFKFGF